jgi:hypothetical protein
VIGRRWRAPEGLAGYLQALDVVVLDVKSASSPSNTCASSYYIDSNFRLPIRSMWPSPKLSLPPLQVIDPHRGVNRNHADGLRRATGFKSGSEPPSAARRRALSRSINARSASRTSADFSLRPVYRSAAASRSSSRVRVVCMEV